MADPVGTGIRMQIGMEVLGRTSPLHAPFAMRTMSQLRASIADHVDVAERLLAQSSPPPEFVTPNTGSPKEFQEDLVRLSWRAGREDAWLRIPHAIEALRQIEVVAKYPETVAPSPSSKSLVARALTAVTKPLLKANALATYVTNRWSLVATELGGAAALIKATEPKPGEPGHTINRLLSSDVSDNNRALVTQAYIGAYQRAVEDVRWPLDEANKAAVQAQVHNRSRRHLAKQLLGIFVHRKAMQTVEATTSITGQRVRFLPAALDALAVLEQCEPEYEALSTRADVMTRVIASHEYAFVNAAAALARLGKAKFGADELEQLLDFRATLPLAGDYLSEIEPFGTLTVKALLDSEDAQAKPDRLGACFGMTDSALGQLLDHLTKAPALEPGAGRGSMDLSG